MSRGAKTNLAKKLGYASRVSALNADLHATANWLNDNKLTLNIDKTKAMLIGSDSRLRKFNSLSVSVLDNQLDSVRSFKHLGLYYLPTLRGPNMSNT